jgi:hypothetical protein
MSPSETKQSENGSANGTAYLLTEPERGIMQTLRAGVLNAKAAVYDAQNALKAAESAFDGGLGMLANSHGLGGGKLTPHLDAIIKEEV